MPTILDLLNLKHPFPERPFDGISLKKLVLGKEMSKRVKPIGFWKYPAVREKKNPRWVEEQVAKGTTPTPGCPDGIDFRNHQHPKPVTDVFIGECAWVNDRYKLLIHRGKRGETPAPELYDLQDDPKEKTNIAEANPEVTQQMLKELRAWQTEVETSLTGADY